MILITIYYIRSKTIIMVPRVISHEDIIKIIEI